MISINPEEESVAKVHAYMLGAVAPRPIAFVSTIDKNGKINLSPYSFFNGFSANPPTLIFSPARRVRDNTTKHTLENVLEVPEACINVVTYDMVHQTSLASTEYPKGTNEFVKAGFTPLESERIKPPRVKESPVQFECKVKDVIHLGKEGGAGNLVICEIIKIHLAESVLNENHQLDPQKINLVGRMGGNFYTKAYGSSLFEVPKPLSKLGVGIDMLPEQIRNSHILSGNDLGQLGNVEKIPTPLTSDEIQTDDYLRDAFERLKNDPETLSFHLHKYAKELIKNNQIEAAWKVLLIDPFK
ncbi:MAG: flavin reductase family protein [Chitinophagaceae bacterium]|nr:MAG: flavin reductase family protein [Chitinophagaceae bacterium]